MATKKTKTTERKLAELIARREAIKTKSAMRRIQRAAKAEKPIKGLTRRQKELFREYIERRRIAKQIEVTGSKYIRAHFVYPRTRLMRLYGRVEMGSSGSGDIRDRYVNAPVPDHVANSILNAPTEADAIEIFKDYAPYLAEVHRFDRFEFGGDNYDF